MEGMECQSTAQTSLKGEGLSFPKVRVTGRAPSWGLQELFLPPCFTLDREHIEHDVLYGHNRCLLIFHISALRLANIILFHQDKCHVAPSEENTHPMGRG